MSAEALALRYLGPAARAFHATPDLQRGSVYHRSHHRSQATRGSRSGLLFMKPVASCLSVRTSAAQRPPMLMRAATGTLR